MNGDTLYRLRDALDWNEQRMAEELGLSGPNAAKSVHQMERGKPITGPISKLIERIAEQHNIDLSP